MVEDIIKLYAAHWCPDLCQSQSFLEGNRIPYEFVDVDQEKLTKH